MCDICHSVQETLQLSAPEMRDAVAKGFDPFTTRLVNETTINQWSEGLYDEIYAAPASGGSRDFTPAFQAALKNWKRDLVDTDTSAWRFCPDCANKVRQFTSASSQVSRTAEELRGEQFVRDLVFGNAAPPPRKWQKWWQFWK